MKLSFGIKSVDDLWLGGLSTRTIVGVFSAPNVGKSFLSTQLAAICNLSKEDGGLSRPALLLSTESDPADYALYLKYMRERFGNGDIEIVPLRDVYSLMRFFGMDLEIALSEKGKATTYIFPRSNCSFDKMQEKRNYGLVVLDSFSEPIKGATEVREENFPARSNIINMLMTKFQRYVERNDQIILLTLHSSKSPRDRAIGEIHGGPALFYNVKYVLYLHPFTAKERKKYGVGRYFIRYRYQGLPSAEEMSIDEARQRVGRPVLLKENFGFADVEA